MTEALDRVAALVDVDRHAEARRPLAEHLATEPDDARALCLLAMCEDAAGEHERMVEAAERACAADPADEWAHRLRALALTHRERPVEAVEAAHEAVRLEPDGWQGRVVLAAALASDPRHGRRALAAAREAARLAPDEAATHFLLGVLQHGRGRYGAARRAYERTLRYEPSHVGAMQNLGRIAESRSQIGTSLRLFGAAARTAPGEVAGTGHLRRVVRQVLGLAWATALCVMFVLLWAMFPVAWAVAAVILAGSALWSWRMLRVLPPPLRSQAASWLRTDPRLATLAWSTAALLTVGVVIGVVATATVDVGSGPSAGRRMVVLVCVALAAMVVTAVTVKVVERRVGVLPDEVRADAENPRGQVGGWHLFARFRQFWASAVLALLLVPGTDAQPDWVLRAALSAVAVAGYLWYHRRVGRQPPRRLAPAWDRLARWYAPVTLAWLVCLACVVAIGALPDAWQTALGLAAVPPLVLVPCAAVVQVGRLVARVTARRKTAG